MNLGLATLLSSALLCTGAIAQTPAPSQSPPAPPSFPPMPNLPSGVGPQNGAPAGVGARPMPSIPEPAIPAPTQHITPPPSSANLISFLDSTTPYVQAFDFVLMVVAGIFCLRAARAPGLTILAISCFVSAIILLGFFLFGILNGRGVIPQLGYIIARLLAPFELLLFVIGIIIVARRNASHR
jgi:hypothetical protein